MVTLDEQLTDIERKIDGVEVEIKNSSDPEEKKHLRKKEEHLRKKEEHLRKKEEHLREEKLILLRRQEISGK
jgi:hypothetical protein